MIKQFLKLGFVLALAVTLGSCEKEIVQPPQINWNTYTGNWENVNAFGSNIDRIIITRREVGKITVQLWGSCGMEACERGLFSYSESDLNEPTLPMNIIWNNQELPLRLSITASGKMELKTTEDNSGLFDTQYYSWAETASFYQQVTQEDAGSVHLVSTPINGSPQDPDNRLTSGSILVFQTNEGRLGKIQIHGNDHFLSIRWQTWSPDGTVYQFSDYLPLHKIGYYDLEYGQLDESSNHKYSDFYWSIENHIIRWLEPANGAAFAIYHLE